MFSVRILIPTTNHRIFVCQQTLFFRKKHPKPNSPRRSQGVDVDILPLKIPATVTTLEEILDACRQVLIQRGAAKVVHTWIEIDNVQQNVVAGRRAVRLAVTQGGCDVILLLM